MLILSVHSHNFVTAGMNSLNQQQRRDLILDFYKRHEEKGKPFTVQHFAIAGIPRSTVYNILCTASKRGTTARRRGSGGHNKKLSNASRAAIVRNNVDKCGISLRRLARKHNVNPSTMSRIFQSKGVMCHHRQRAPLYTDEQLERVKRNSKKLVQTFKGVTVVMDDETYFKLKNDFLPGNDHFFTRDINCTPSQVRYKRMKKFPTQIMMWLCISPHGMSEPFFLERPNSVTGEVYREECIKKRLLPFLISHPQPLASLMFWPDLASAHYARATTDLLVSKSVRFVPKVDNPPNLPQCRPIENFWAQLKSQVYMDGWEATSVRQLKMRITAKLKNMDFRSVQNDFAAMRGKLRCVSRDGPYSAV